MVQNTMRALPGSLSGGRSTIAEYSARSRGIIGLAIRECLSIRTFSRHRRRVQPNAQMPAWEVRQELSIAHSRESGNPGRRSLSLLAWVPAFAGTSGKMLGRCGHAQPD